MGNGAVRSLCGPLADPAGKNEGPFMSADRPTGPPARGAPRGRAASDSPIPMNPVAAIALLALRQTLRSRVVLALFAAAGRRASCTAGHPPRRHARRPHPPATHLFPGIAGFLLFPRDPLGRLRGHLERPTTKPSSWCSSSRSPACISGWASGCALLVLNALLRALSAGPPPPALHAQLRRGGFDPAALDRARLRPSALDSVPPLPDIEDDVRADPNHSARSSIGVRGRLLDSLRRARLARL